MILAAWYHTILAFAFMVLAVLLMIVILLQRGKGVGLAGAFGGTGGTTAFGAKTGDVLTWITICGAALLLVYTVALNFVFREPTAGLNVSTPPPVAPLESAAQPMDIPVPPAGQAPPPAAGLPPGGPAIPAGAATPGSPSTIPPAGNTTPQPAPTPPPAGNPAPQQPTPTPPPPTEGSAPSPSGTWNLESLPGMGGWDATVFGRDCA